MSASKEDLKKIIESLTEKDIEREFNEFAKNPGRVGKELGSMTERMSESDINAGVKKFGGAEGFMHALIMYLAFKAALIRKGVKVGIAAGAGAALLFGAGSLCHAAAASTGVAAMDEIGNGIEMVGDFAQNVAEVGLEVAADSAGFFGDIFDGILSLFR